MTLGRRLAAAAIGTALLLANSVATGTALYALILVFAPVLGAHFNPVVSLVVAMNKQMEWRHAIAYVGMQAIGAFACVAAARAMFGELVSFASQHERTGAAQWWAGGVATVGLLMVILGSARQRLPAIAATVGAYITAAYWFTVSTSFANPAVTLARTASDTFAGIQPANAPAFILA